MRNWYTEDVKTLFTAIASLENEEECRRFFEDVCTVREIIEIAQRLKVARMLSDKVSYSAINKATGVSSATISRVSRCLDYGSGGYRLMIERMEKESQA